MRSIKYNNGDPIKKSKAVKKVLVEGPNGETFYIDDPEYAVQESDTTSYTHSAEKLLERQMMAESSGDPKAVSPMGAMGLYQIMPGTLKDLEDRGLIPRGLDPFNPEHNKKMRDAKMASLERLQFIANPPQEIPEINRLARVLSSYNWGEGNTRDALEKAKKDGVNIYGDPREWSSYLPTETQQYLERVLFE